MIFILKVVIVPKCNSKNDSNCVDFVEQYNARESNGGLVNKKNLPKGDYLTLGYLEELVQRSTTRFNLTSLELKWTFV